MRNLIPKRSGPLAEPALIAAMLCALLMPVADAGELLQPGFYHHEPATITIDNARSGAVCTDGDGSQRVCEPAHKVIITGEETCDYSPGEQYPCTRFGFEFDYAGAEPGTELDCRRSTTDPRGRRQQDDYTKPIASESGHYLYTSFRTFAPVDERIIMTEVHDCSYAGERLSTVEFLIYYEPGVGGPGSDAPTRPYLSEVPDACSDPYLTESTASGLLQATGARRHAASEYIPALQSQCIYGARGGQEGQVGYVFKFMLSGMFDVERVPEPQLLFNAAFANGGTEPVRVMQEPGARAFIFEKGDRTTLFMITGIRGADDPVGDSREFTATYYIDHPEIEAETRQSVLLEQARLHIRIWRGQ